MVAVAWARLILTYFGWIQEERTILKMLHMNLSSLDMERTV